MPPPPNLDSTVYRYTPSSARAATQGWNYALARAAVDNAKRGQFYASYQLGVDMWANPAIKAARERRIAAAAMLPYFILPHERAPGRIEYEASVEAWPMFARLLEDTIDDIAMHGFCVWQHPLEVIETEIGPRYAIREIEIFPVSCVEHGSAMLARDGAGPYDPDRYYARTPDGPRWVELPRPGETDLHWTLLGTGPRPHLRGALVALDLCFVAGQLGRRAMAKMINTIGRTSPIGELPDGIVTRDADGNENPIATDMLNMVEAIGETQVAGIHMKGARVYPFEVTAQTGQLFPQWMQIAAQEIQWALLGHDRAIAEGDQYADPTSQSAPQDVARRDVRCIERAASDLLTGVAALNCEKPIRIVVSGNLPDEDQDMRREAVQKRRAADDEHRAKMLAAGKAAAEQLDAERKAGAVVDEKRVAQVYALAGVEPPTLAPTKPQGDAVYAYDLDGGIVTVNEQRAAKGLPPVAWGLVTVPECRARVAAGWTTSPAGWVPPPVVQALPTIAPANGAAVPAPS